MNGTQQPYNDAELKKLAEHKKWFESLSGFTCIACSMARPKKLFGRFGVFRPNRKYTKIELPITYILCKECNGLPEGVVYERTETWLVDHKKIEL